MLDELKKAVEVLKTIQNDFTVVLDRHSGKEVEVYYTPAVFSYEKNYKQAFDLMLTIVQHILSACEGMPKKKVYSLDVPHGIVALEHRIDGYNEALDDCTSWTARKEAEFLEKISVEKLGGIFWDYFHTITIANENIPNEPNRQVIFKEDIPKLIIALNEYLKGE